MSEQTRRLVEEVAPKKIDRADVLGELMHRFAEADPNNAIEWVLDELAELDILRYREPADDPAKNDLGTIRLEKHDDDPGHSVWLCTKDRLGRRAWYCVYSTAIGNQGGRMEDDEVAGLPVVGGLPGTPAAAEAEKAAQREVSMQTRQRVAELLVRGQFADAVNVVGVAWTPWDEARQFVKSMPEYRTGENHRQVEDVELPDAAEPRVFQGDGPEPPSDVPRLFWEDHADDDVWLYLHRVDNGWMWSPNVDKLTSITASVNSWSGATRMCPGRYREVV